MYILVQIITLHSLYNHAVCAESDAIMRAFKFHADLSSSALYTTSPPCYHCAKIVVQSGVKFVFYSPSSSEDQERLKHPNAVMEMFRRAGIPYV